jgi:hypothetical protein
MMGSTHLVVIGPISFTLRETSWVDGGVSFVIMATITRIAPQILLRIQ